MPVFKSVDKDFFKNWSSDMAYVLGFFAADGYMTLNKRGGQFWCIQIRDGDLLEKIKETIKSEHKISIRVRKKPNENNQYRLQIGSVEMCDDLRKLGYYENKTKSLSIPNIPDKYFSDFVRGYFDGDGNVWAGHVNKSRYTPTYVILAVFTSCSSLFLKELQKRLGEHLIQGGSLYKSKKKNFFRLQYSINNSLKLYDFMYNRLGESKLFLQRKKEVFERYKKGIDNAVVV